MKALKMLFEQEQVINLRTITVSSTYVLCNTVHGEIFGRDSLHQIIIIKFSGTIDKLKLRNPVENRTCIEISVVTHKFNKG